MFTLGTMAKPRPHMKRSDTTASLGINALINAANKNDRFKLLEDDAIQTANLTNAIHPLFHQLEDDRQLQLALQLASQYLLHDRLLEFFIPLIYGREVHDVRYKKNYLCNPHVHASKARQGQLLAGVRRALQCLAKHLVISFVDQKQKRVYACTLAKDIAPLLTPSCCPKFQENMSPAIEISDKFLAFYTDPQGYAQASRCAQYRHDFLFASTLVHEVVHAVGVMRRGNTLEPYYQVNYPGTEWGYAWENFMFGSIVNPQDKERPGTHLLMRKVWADAELADTRGGKEYCDVPMSWVARWFRTETWSIVAEKGPAVIPPPATHFKIQGNLKLGAWLVSSDKPAVGKDIAKLRQQWQKPTDIIRWNECTPEQLKISNVPVPLRVHEVPRPSIIQKLISSATMIAATDKPRPTTNKLTPLTTAHHVSAYRMSSPCRIQRKRQTETEADRDRSPGEIKRIRS